MLNQQYVKLLLKTFYTWSTPTKNNHDVPTHAEAQKNRSVFQTDQTKTTTTTTTTTRVFKPSTRSGFQSLDVLGLRCALPSRAQPTKYECHHVV